MLVIQAILISLLCYLGSLSSPWIFGTTGGWYTLSRPLVSGMLIGLITGDVKEGIIIGVAVQAVYIALVTPGGQMPADLNYVAYPAMAVAIMSHASTGVAVTLATTIGIVGTIVWNFFQVVDSYWNHRAQHAIQNHDEKGFKFNAVFGPQILNFLLRFIPSFLVIYFGSGFAKQFVANTPKYLIDVMSFLGGALPAIGIVMLLLMVIKKQYMWIFFLFGFTCVVFLKLNMIALAIVGATVALVYFFAINNSSSDDSSSEQKSNEEDEEEF